MCVPFAYESFLFHAKHEINLSRRAKPLCLSYTLSVMLGFRIGFCQDTTGKKNVIIWKIFLVMNITK